MAKHRGQQAQDQQGTRSLSQVSPLETQQFGGSPEPSAVEESTPAATPVAPPAPVAATPKSPDLDAILAALSPEQLAKIRLKAIGEGVVVPAAIIARDGSLTVSVRLDSDLVEQLKNWQDETDTSIADTAVRYIKEALTGYIFGDWNPVPETEPAPVVAAAAVTK